MRIATGIRATVIVALAFVVLAGARPANAQVTRLAENMGYVGGPAFFSSDSPSDGGAGGTLFYSNRVTVPAGANTLFIDLTGVAALLGYSYSAEFTCTIDSSLLCVPQANNDADGDPLGWISLTTLSYYALPFEVSFNTIHMTWCIPPGRYTQGGTQHTIGLRIAQENPWGYGVLLQQAKVNIDAVQVSDTTNACTTKGFIPATVF